MSKDKNIGINNSLGDAPILSKLQDKNTLEIPPNYFQDLESEIISSVGIQANIASPKFGISRMLYYAVAASVAILITFFAIKFYSNNSDSDFIADDNQNIDIIVNDSNSLEQKYSPKNIANNTIQDTPQDNNKLNKEIIVNNNDKEIIKNDVNSVKQNSTQENLPLNNNSIHNEEIVQQNAPDFKSTPLNNNPAGLNIGTHSQQKNTSSSEYSTARKAKHKNWLLPDDTCLNHSFVYTFSENIDCCKSLKFKWNGKDEGNSFSINKSGTYFVEYIVDGVYNRTDTMKVSIIAHPKSQLISDMQVCNHESVLLRTGLSNKLYSFKWSVSEQNKSEILINKLEPGIQEISVAISSCCDTIVSTTLLNVENCNIVIPNIITPNGDGYNDAFVVSGLEYYPKSSLTIFNRSGKMVYQSLDYKNNWRAENVQDGNYFYSLIINDKHKTEKGGILKIMR